MNWMDLIRALDSWFSFRLHPQWLSIQSHGSAVIFPHRVGVVHHIFRNDIQINFFDTFWFIVVTMSTVGYGDYFPVSWPGKLVVILFIIIAIVYLIPRVEGLYQSFMVQQKLQSSVSLKRSGEKFILICSTSLKPIVLRDFLTEFYSDPTRYVRCCWRVVWLHYNNAGANTSAVAWVVI